MEDRHRASYGERVLNFCALVSALQYSQTSMYFINPEILWTLLWASLHEHEWLIKSLAIGKGFNLQGQEGGIESSNPLIKCWVWQPAPFLRGVPKVTSLP